MTGFQATMVYAFPGTGKTQLAENNPDVIDLDFGSWRMKKTGMHFWELDDNQITHLQRLFVADQVNKLLHDEVIILTNEPGLERWLPSLDSIKVIPSPEFTPLWLHNILHRAFVADPTCLSDSGSFSSKLVTHFEEWISSAAWNDRTTYRLDSYAEWDGILKLLRQHRVDVLLR